MKKLLPALLALFLFSQSAHAQLDMLKKKAEEKAKKIAEKEAEKKKQQATNEVKNSDNTPSNNQNSSNNSTMPPANNPAQTTAKKRTKLTIRTSNAQFPDDPFYKENVGKVIVYETERRDSKIPFEQRIRKEMQVNEAHSFYVAMPSTPCDFPIYLNGDTLKNDEGGTQANVKLVFKVKNAPYKVSIYNPYPIRIGQVEAVIDMADFYGSNAMGDQRDYQDYRDLVDSFPNNKIRAWENFLDTLPIGRHEVEVTAWLSHQYVDAESFYPLSIASGEFTLVKTKENANLNYYKRFRTAVLNRRIREAKKLFVKDEGITSETHKANVGKIVFSKAPIAKGAENVAAFTDQFTGNDLIYGRVYLDQTLSNVITRNPSDTLRVVVGEYLMGHIYINGESMNSAGADPSDSQDDIFGWECRFPDNIDENNTFTTHLVAVLPERTPEYIENSHPSLPYYLNALSPGTYTIKLEAFGSRSEKIYATGEFKYTKVAGTVLKYGYNLSSIGCKKGMDNDALEGQIRKAFATDEDYSYYSKNYSLVSVNICDREWTVNRNAFGVVLTRGIDADLLIKDKFGNYRLLKQVAAMQEHNGSAYGLMYLGGRSSDYYVVPGK